MQTTVSEAGPFQRTVTLHIAESDLDRAAERAARKLSKDLKIKGFRPGKAPRRVVEATVGADTLRTEAIEEALPEALGEVLREQELVPAVAPRVTDMRDLDDGVEVEVEVTLWPKLDAPPHYRDRIITLEAPAVTPEEVEAQIERLQRQFAELETVSRPAREGDYVSIDLSGTRHGQPVDEASAKDFLYEVGSHSFIEGLDEQLTGASPGEIIRFNATLPEAFGKAGGEEITLQVLVKDVRQRKLPPTTDEWVSEVSEFESMAELRETLEDNLYEVKKASLRAEFRSRVLDDLLQEMEVELPEPLIGAETERVLHRFLHELEERGITVEQYLGATGQEQESLLDQVRSEAVRNLKTNILLQAVVEAEGLAVSQEDLDDVTGALARAAERDVDDYRAMLRKGNREEALAGDILRQKAFDALVQAAQPVDAKGDPIDLQPVAQMTDRENERDQGGSRTDQPDVAEPAGVNEE